MEQPKEDKIEGQDRRKAQRIATAFTLVYSVENPYALRIKLGVADDIDAIMLNLSELGMAIMTIHDLFLGAQLYIKFNIIDLRLIGEERLKHMEITGIVASNTVQPDNSHRIGICFNKISGQDKSAIRDFVKRNNFPSS